MESLFGANGSARGLAVPPLVLHSYLSCRWTCAWYEIGKSTIIMYGDSKLSGQGDPDCALLLNAVGPDCSISFLAGDYPCFVGITDDFRGRQIENGTRI